MKPVSTVLIVFFSMSLTLTFVSTAAQFDPEVYQIQKALKTRGYDPGPLDGQYGPSTRNAIKQFQRDFGLLMTGTLDQQTKSKLGNISSGRGIGLTKEPKERRLALVIGNGAYKSSPLKNPINDANDMAHVLTELSFDVILETNANKRTMLTAVDQFGKRLRNAKVGLFFFAGHGLQVKGINYLIPIGAYVTNETDVEIEGFDMRRILGRMEMAASEVNIIFLDACRDNPFKRSFRSTSRGLAKIDAPRGTFIVYATSPGDVAADGEGRNSPFTKHLLKDIARPNIPIEKLIKKVRRGVLTETYNQQMPWQTSSLTGDFYFGMKDFGEAKPPNLEPDVSNLAPKDKISFDDILQAAEKNKKEKETWTRWQDSRNSEYETVRKIDSNKYVTAEQKADAWQRFLSMISRDNPYSKQDDDMRSHARTRVSYWQQKSIGKQVTPNQSSPESVPETRIVGRDGHYVAYGNGVVKDTKTDFEWVVGPDRDMTWHEAKSWSETLNIDAGGWRMPTVDELKTLFNERAGKRNMTPLLKTTGWRVWSAETKGSSSAWVFGFHNGIGYFSTRSDPTTARSFALRYRSGMHATIKKNRPKDQVEIRDTKTEMVAQDGTFIEYSTGVVKDTKTDFEWVVGPDRDMTWHEAKSWSETLNIDAGGWRMPTVDELKTLFNERAGKRNMTPLLKTTGWRVWSAETKGSSSAWVFGFHNGIGYLSTRSDSATTRSFALRYRR